MGSKLGAYRNCQNLDPSETILMLQLSKCVETPIYLAEADGHTEIIDRQS